MFFLGSGGACDWGVPSRMCAPSRSGVLARVHASGRTHRSHEGVVTRLASILSGARRRTSTAPAAGPLRSHLSDIACRSTDFVSDLQPFQWNYGQAGPSQNEFSWTNLSSMIYLEQPVGTGFSQGKPTARVSRESASRWSARGS